MRFYFVEFSTGLMLAWLLVLVSLASWAPAPVLAANDTLALNSDPPATPQRLIFIHHSTGENWLSDENGRLGIALRDNNYFVSDTNYGWGPDAIGDRTDIGNWYEWFLGEFSANYTTALFDESEQHASYSRLPVNPGGPNTVVMFKSCFPNSALRGPTSPPPPIDSNPLRGQDASSDAHTVANAKGIYTALLTYFATRQDKLFVAIAAPPLSDRFYSANARYFNQWLFSDWLRDYPHNNVAVFDFYNVLTTNGGSADANDLGAATGNHHRYQGGAVQHKIDGDDDGNANILEYPSGDDHPSVAGNLKATGEFLPLLNVMWHCWKGDGGCAANGSGGGSGGGGGGGGNDTVPEPKAPSAPVGLVATAAGPRTVVLTWNDTSSDETEFVLMRRQGGSDLSDYNTVGENEISYSDTTRAKMRSTMSHSYAVKACNAAGCSAATAEAAVPFVPIGVRVVRQSPGQVLLSWGARSPNQSGFRVHRAAGRCPRYGFEAVADVNGSSPSSWVDSGLQAARRYSYKITALSTTGDSQGVSWYSTCVSVKA